jgi:hypothetical protein
MMMTYTSTKQVTGFHGFGRRGWGEKKPRIAPKIGVKTWRGGTKNKLIKKRMNEME